MDNIYMLVIRTENQTKTIKISDELFQKLYDSICILDEFSQLTFLGNSYLKAKAASLFPVPGSCPLGSMQQKAIPGKRR